MARLARVVVPNTPHHVTQRGNRRQTTFFEDGDYLAYLQIAAEAFTAAGVQVSGNTGTRYIFPDCRVSSFPRQRRLAPVSRTSVGFTASAGWAEAVFDNRKFNESAVRQLEAVGRCQVSWIAH